jgi:hypothetical protein
MNRNNLTKEEKQLEYDTWVKLNLKNKIKTSFTDKDRGISAQAIGDAIFESLPKQVAIRVVEQIISRLSGY